MAAKNMLMHSSLWLLIRLNTRGEDAGVVAVNENVEGTVRPARDRRRDDHVLDRDVRGPNSAGRFAPQTVRNVGAMMMAVLTCSTLLFGSSEGGVAFSPAEVEFLFPAPIPRRHLLIYRIVIIELITIPTSIMLGLTFQRNAPTLLGAVIGSWLAFSFMSLVQMVWQLVAGIAQQATIARSRKWVGRGSCSACCSRTGNGRVEHAFVCWQHYRVRRF